MRVFVINLRTCTERRSTARTKLLAAGVRFEFFDAISGESAIDNRLFEGLDADEFGLNTGRTIAPGEIGCFASHRSLWKIAVRLNEPIIVLEDDFDLLDSFPEALASAEALIDEAGFLRLQTETSARKRPIAGHDQFLLSRYTKAPQSTMGYCVSPSVARRFVAGTKILKAPVDIFIRNFWEHGQPLFALTPYCVAPSVLSVASTIRGRRKDKKLSIFAARRMLRKGSGYWRRWHFNVRQRYSPAGAARSSARDDKLRDRDNLHRTESRPTATTR